MNAKDKRKILGINLFLFALLFGLISLNKEILRPAFAHTPYLGIFTGSFPNFIAAYIIRLAFVNAVLQRKPKHGQLIVYLTSALIFVILTVEEIIPLWGASTHYDIFDIVASGLGSLLAIITFRLLQPILQKDEA